MAFTLYYPHKQRCEMDLKDISVKKVTPNHSLDAIAILLFHGNNNQLAAAL